NSSLTSPPRRSSHPIHPVQRPSPIHHTDRRAVTSRFKAHESHRVVGRFFQDRPEKPLLRCDRKNTIIATMAEKYRYAPLKRGTREETLVPMRTKQQQTSQTRCHISIFGKLPAQPSP